MTSIIDILINFIASLLKELYTLIKFIISLFYPEKGYAAHFTPSREILNKKNTGFSLGGRNMDIKTSFQHLLVSAPSGIGKS